MDKIKIIFEAKVFLPNARLSFTTDESDKSCKLAAGIKLCETASTLHIIFPDGQQQWYTGPFIITRTVKEIHHDEAAK